MSQKEVAQAIKPAAKKKLEGVDRITEGLFSVLPAPLKEEALPLLAPVKVMETETAKTLHTDLTEDAKDDDEPIATNVTEIHADDLFNKEDYYKNLIKNHSLAMFHKQSLER